VELVGFGFSLGELRRMELAEAAHWLTEVTMYRAGENIAERD
jgi:hypothetical protein